MSCILVECSFVDSKQDMNKYNANDIAEAIVSAIINESVSTSTCLQSDVENNCSYSTNAIVQGDFLYVRDSVGTIISGRQVDIGDNITVLYVDHETQLALVEYPTPTGTRTGYVTNAVNCIKYYFQNQYFNGSTSEPVYDESGNQIGALNPFEKATPLYRKNGKLNIVYNTSKGENSKSGYVVYNGNFNNF